jgi:trans-aconitate 2-methyltransferase
MASWDSCQYLKFGDERTRPARDLVRRIEVPTPRHVIDLGCGPGNSTSLLADAWPTAQVTGLDSSAAMLVTAQKMRSDIRWVEGDIGSWSADEECDVVFSNAALQWVPDHAQLLPQLWTQVASGGVLAFQVPANLEAPAHQLMREIAGASRWQSHFSHPVREWHVESGGFYYDVLASFASRVELWFTDYIHVLPGPEAIVEWYRGTGLRPWLDALPSQDLRERFLADYLAEITRAFPRQSNGKVLFPFRRLFVIACRG